MNVFLMEPSSPSAPDGSGAPNIEFYLVSGIGLQGTELERPNPRTSALRYPRPGDLNF